MTQEKSDLQKKEIKISGVETKQMSNGNYFSKIKDENEDRYMLFHTKKDGTDSVAFAGLKQLPMSGIGCDVEILFKEEPYEKDGQTYTSRKIMGLKKLVEAKPNVDDVKIADGSIVF